MGMKWFKHYVGCLDNPKMQELLSIHGHVGYFIYFGMIELYAREFDPVKNEPYKFNTKFLCRKFMVRKNLLMNCIFSIKSICVVVV